MKTLLIALLVVCFSMPVYVANAGQQETVYVGKPIKNSAYFKYKYGIKPYHYNKYNNRSTYRGGGRYYIYKGSGNKYYKK